MRWLRRREQQPVFEVREDYRTYALHGDVSWGNSITWTGGAPDGNEGRVHGWVPSLPRTGDRLLVKMRSGRWAAWVFTKVEPCGDPRDMFFGTVLGPVVYVGDEEVPAGAYGGGAGVMADYV